MSVGLQFEAILTRSSKDPSPKEGKAARATIERERQDITFEDEHMKPHVATKWKDSMETNDEVSDKMLTRLPGETTGDQSQGSRNSNP
ncbi:hypothetical protein MMC19_000978 [Ptychographa xylographoides]|nr:hypothetical protein [Ptychographa xylographoides]